MKAKILTLMIASAFALVLLASFATALTITDKSVSLSNSADSNTITITGDEEFNIVVLPASQQDSSGKVSFELASTDLSAGAVTFDLDVSATELSDTSFLEDYSTTFIITATPVNVSPTNPAIDFNVAVTYSNEEVCDYYDNNNKLKVDISEINVISGFGDEDDYWYPFDEVEVELEVSFDGWDNDDEVDLDDIEWALYKDGSKFIDGDESGFDLEDGDEETMTFTFKLDEDADELEDGPYTLYVWVTGEVKSDLSTHDEKNICASEQDTIDLRIDDDFVILHDIEVTSTNIECGSSIQITADVWNIGDDDQDDVYVIISHGDLGISEKIEIGDIDSLEDEKLDVTIQIPENMEEKSYHLRLEVFDEDDDIYENDEDGEAIFYLPIELTGCGLPGDSVMVQAVLESGGKAGEELVVRATITNSGNSLASYTLNAAGYTEWAESATVEPATIAVASGESKDVMITLQVNKDAEGSNSFNLEVLSDSNVVKTQPVAVTIEKSGFSFGITGNAISGNNWYLWGIGLLNVILVIIIIVVAVRVARS